MELRPSNLPGRVQDAVRGEAAPVGRNLAEIRGLMNQLLRRLSALEGDLLTERNARVDDLALLVDLIASGWLGAASCSSTSVPSRGASAVAAGAASAGTACRPRSAIANAMRDKGARSR